MIERLKIHDYDVEVRRRPRQRTLRLRVTSKGQLRVTCAMTVPKREILQFVSSSEPFIREQLEELKQLRAKYPPKQFVEGETILFFGRERKLNIVENDKRLKAAMVAGEFILMGPASSAEEKRQAVRAFFRRCGKRYISQRLDYLSRVMGLTPASVSFRSQSTRWGSCSGEGHISLNWRLMAAPPEVIDYVVVHELAHLQHHDHSPRFWKLVEAYAPHYKTLKGWLNENQWSLEFLAKHQEV